MQYLNDANLLYGDRICGPFIHNFICCREISIMIIEFRVSDVTHPDAAALKTIIFKNADLN